MLTWTTSSPVKTSLPDVNVLLALSAEGHVHHKPARLWFYAQLTDSVAICRVTQMGLLRLLTNSSQTYLKSPDQPNRARRRVG